MLNTCLCWARRPHAGLIRSVVIAAGLAMIAPLTLSPALAQRIELPKGPGRELVYAKCRTCHDLGYLVASKGLTKIMWDGILDDMAEFGLVITDAQHNDLLSYLSTYLGPHPAPAAPEVAAKPQGEEAKPASGEAIFKSQCISCHQETGEGVPGTFPPLAGNTDLFADHLLPVYVMLHGMSGPITVNGKTFAGEMPPFDYLADQEIAAIVNYIRSAWGNAAKKPSGMSELTPADIAEARKKKMDAEQVWSYRKGKLHEKSATHSD